MLKIKDDIDLKELEKFGFAKYNSSYYCGNLYGDSLWATSDKCIIVSAEQDIDEELIDTLFDLIKADMVEKVEELVMKYEEVLEIIERVRNGEKAEDIIDFEQETADGEITPQQALEVINEALICKTCKKPIVDKGELFVCKECAEKSREQFYQTDIGKALKEKDDKGWSWLFGLMLVAGIFGWNGDKDKKE